MEKEEILPYVKDLQLTATVPNEMMLAQNQLIGWCDKKVQYLKLEVEKLKTAYEHAKKMKWKYTTLQNQYNKTQKRVTYYEKIKAALEAGYTIIPNFPVDIFAIRTDKDKPKKYLSTRSWNDIFRQHPNELKVGEGDYKNDRPIVYSKALNEKDKQYWAEDWRDEIEFPLNMAKPIIMEATSNAMALKIFDKFGVFPSARKDDDPVIIGQIVCKENQFKTRIVSFMIAWHINTNVL